MIIMFKVISDEAVAVPTQHSQGRVRPFLPHMILRKRSQVKGHSCLDYEIFRKGVELFKTRVLNVSCDPTLFKRVIYDKN